MDHKKPTDRLGTEIKPGDYAVCIGSNANVPHLSFTRILEIRDPVKVDSQVKAQILAWSVEESLGWRLKVRAAIYSQPTRLLVIPVEKVPPGVVALLNQRRVTQEIKR